MNRLHEPLIQNGVGQNGASDSVVPFGKRDLGGDDRRADIVSVRLLEKMAWVRAQERYLNLLKKLTSVGVVVLDDFGLRALTPQQLQDLYDLMDGWVERLATIVTTQLPVENRIEVPAFDPSIESQEKNGFDCVHFRPGMIQGRSLSAIPASVLTEDHPPRIRHCNGFRQHSCPLPR